MNADLSIILAWYKEADWSEWQKICSDQMCSSWSEWHHGAEKTLTDASKNRILVHTSTIRPQPYLQWIKQTGKTISGHTRSEFAAFQIKDRLAGKHTMPKSIPTQAELNRLFRKAIEHNPEIEIFNVFDPYLRRPSASICPIFREDNQGKPEQYGSGVFMRLDDEFFMLSAAHVFDDFKKHVILIPGQKSLVKIHGPYSTTAIPEHGSRENDHFDMGYFHFNSIQQADIDSSFLFLDERDCDPMDVTSDGDAYTLIGYQSELSESSVTVAQTEISRISCSGVQDHRYQKLGLDPKTHLLLQYRMKKGMNTKSMIKGKKHNFEGMSGGGVFAWSMNFPNPTAVAQPHLVGIITAYSIYHNVFIATRLHHLLSAIHKKFPYLPISYKSD